MPNVAESFLKGHAAGQAELQQTQETEERKLRQAVLKHQLSREKLQDLMLEFQTKFGAAENRAKTTSGQPELSYQPSDIQGGYPLDRVPNAQGLDLHSKPLQLTGMPTPAFPEMGIPAGSIPRQTLEQLSFQQARQKRLEQPLIHVGVDESVVDPANPTVPVYVNPERRPPTDWQAFMQTTADKAGVPSWQALTPDQRGNALKEWANRNATSQAAGDRSYQFTATQLNNLNKPLTDRLGRLATLQDTINQKSPQADALIAPELLTVMAGGQGSGLRMNEAEIARIVGGRSNWESLKAAVNKWRGPGAALTVTDAQRGQIQSLLSTVNDRLTRKSQILDGAMAALIEAPDSKSHRRILLKAQQDLGAIDREAGPAPASATTRPRILSITPVP